MSIWEESEKLMVYKKNKEVEDMERQMDKMRECRKTDIRKWEWLKARHDRLVLTMNALTARANMETTHLNGWTSNWHDQIVEASEEAFRIESEMCAILGMEVEK